MEEEGLLFIFHKNHLAQRFKQELGLESPSESWDSQGVMVEMYAWKGIARLCVCWGVYWPRDHQTLDMAQRVALNFPQCRVSFVCLASEKQRMDTNAAVIPLEWSVCTSPQEIQTALGEPLTEEQLGGLARYMPNNVGVTRGIRFVSQLPLSSRHHFTMHINVQDRRDRQEALMRFFVRQDQDFELEEVLRRSLNDVDQEARERPNIREQKRSERPWDALFQPPVQADTPDDEGVCVVCTENYSTMQTVDAAGLCDHVVLCDACARIIMDTTQKCPICRATALTVRRNEKYLPNNNKRVKTE